MVLLVALNPFQQLVQQAAGKESDVQEQMPTPQNSSGLPRPVDPLAPFFDKLVRGLKMLASMVALPAGGADAVLKTKLEKMALELQQEMNSRVQAVVKKNQKQIQDEASADIAATLGSAS